MQNKVRISEIDMLRGLLCIPIVLIHYKSVANLWDVSSAKLPFNGIFGLFYEMDVSVMPFFWISGFLMSDNTEI